MLLWYQEDEWSSEPHKDANLSDFEEWLDDDMKVSASFQVGGGKQVKTLSPIKSELSFDSKDSDEVSTVKYSCDP